MAGKTGPTSPAGKAKVVSNAVKHGLRSNKWMFPQERADFDALPADLDSEYQPSTATQRILVERIALCTTKLRRLHTIEDARFHKARAEDVASRMQRYPHIGALSLEETEMAALPPLKLLETLSRYQTTLDRQLCKAIGELLVLQDRARVSAMNNSPKLSAS